MQIEGSPIWFAEEVLGLKLYPWQDWALAQCADPRGRHKIALAAANGSGKSERVVASLALWVPYIFLQGTCVITSADSKQLDNQIWPAIRKHAAKFPNWVFNEREVKTPTGGRIVAFTTDDAGRAEGWHKGMDGAAALLNSPMLIICDEAKSIPEPIFEAIKLRCNFTWLLLISSTGIRMGSFYDAFADPSYISRRVTYQDCPHLDKERIADLLKLGEDHPIVASTLLSKFMDQDAANSFFLTLEQFDQCQTAVIPARHTRDRVAFCDFAAGGDENVLALRSGNQVTVEAAWTDRNAMAAAGKFISLFKSLQLESNQIFADEGGMGRPIIDRMAEIGWDINRVNNGEAPQDPRFRNRGSEIWYDGCAKIARGEVILPKPCDLILKKQLCSRKQLVTSDGRIQCEPKPDMAKRGVTSPDRADAILGALGHQQMKAVLYSDPLTRQFEIGESWRDRFAEMEDSQESSAMRGFDAGS